MKEILNRKITYIMIGWLLILAAIALDEGLTVPRYEINSDKIKKPLWKSVKRTIRRGFFILPEFISYLGTVMPSSVAIAASISSQPIIM